MNVMHRMSTSLTYEAPGPEISRGKQNSSVLHYVRRLQVQLALLHLIRFTKGVIGVIELANLENEILHIKFAPEGPLYCSKITPMVDRFASLAEVDGSYFVYQAN